MHPRILCSFPRSYNLYSDRKHCLRSCSRRFHGASERSSHRHNSNLSAFLIIPTDSCSSGCGDQSKIQSFIKTRKINFMPEYYANWNSTKKHLSSTSLFLCHHPHQPSGMVVWDVFNETPSSKLDHSFVLIHFLVFLSHLEFGPERQIWKVHWWWTQSCNNNNNNNMCTYRAQSR